MYIDLSVWICFIISSFLSSENRQDPSRLPSLALAPRGFALRCFGRRYNGGRSEVLQRKLGAGHGSMRSVWTVFTTVAYLCYDDVYADVYALFVDVAVPSKSSLFVTDWKPYGPSCVGYFSLLLIVSRCSWSHLRKRPETPANAKRGVSVCAFAYNRVPFLDGLEPYRAIHVEFFFYW